ncbi:MAG TPA: LUD domain-containing protein [Candidatus Acidoferrales bacterium]|nr:LUD domain-containing protein [Candidatus Acidoferrales bacterium]
MTERENILGRIREALRVKAPLPGSNRDRPGHAPAEPPVTHAREWLPAVGDSTEEQFELFARNCTDLKATFLRLASRDELKAALVHIRDAEKWQRIASHAGELSNFACQALGLPALLTDHGYDAQALEKCDAGITECDALIAQTGGVAVTSRSTGGRALTILPPHHVVIARQEQLVPDLPAAFALLQRKYAPNFPSMISFITGPSRTGDIERILVLGAHGPRKLTILCV